MQRVMLNHDVRLRIQAERARPWSRDEIISKALNASSAVLGQKKAYVPTSYAQVPSEELLQDEPEKWASYVEGNERLTQLERMRRIVSGQKLYAPRKTASVRLAETADLDETILPPQDTEDYPEDAEDAEDNTEDTIHDIRGTVVAGPTIKHSAKQLLSYHAKQLAQSVRGASADVRKWLKDTRSRGSVKPFTCKGRGPYLLAAIATLTIIGVMVVACISSMSQRNHRVRMPVMRVVPRQAFQY